MAGAANNAAFDLSAIEPYLGPPRRDVYINPRYADQFASTVTIGEMYRGQNMHLTNMMLRLMTGSDEWLFDKVPFRNTGSETRVHWDTITFDQGLLSATPEQGVSRILQSSFNSATCTLHRRGIALLLDSDFYKTEKGKRAYALNLAQIREATLQTCKLLTIQQLLGCNDLHERFLRAEGAMASAASSGLLEAEHDEIANWAILQKPDSGYDVMAALAKRRLALAGTVPDTLIMPPESLHYLPNADNHNAYLSRGAAGVALQDAARTGINAERAFSRYAGLDCREIHHFKEPGTDRPIDALSRVVAIGEMWPMRDDMVPQNYYEDGLYRTFMRDIVIHSEDDDRLHRISFQDALLKSGMFDAFDDAFRYDQQAAFGGVVGAQPFGAHPFYSNGGRYIGDLAEEKQFGMEEACYPMFERSLHGWLRRNAHAFNSTYDHLLRVFTVELSKKGTEECIDVALHLLKRLFPKTEDHAFVGHFNHKELAERIAGRSVTAAVAAAPAGSTPTTVPKHAALAERWFGAPGGIQMKVCTAVEAEPFFDVVKSRANPDASEDVAEFKKLFEVSAGHALPYITDADGSGNFKLKEFSEGLDVEDFLTFVKLLVQLAQDGVAAEASAPGEVLDALKRLAGGTAAKEILALVNRKGYVLETNPDDTTGLRNVTAPPTGEITASASAVSAADLIATRASLPDPLNADEKKIKILQLCGLVENGSNQLRAVATGEERFPVLAKVLFYGASLSKDNMARFLAQDLFVPFDVILMRPHMRYQTSSAIAMLAGPETAEMLVAQPSFSIAETVDTKVIQGHFTAWLSAAVYRKENVLPIFDVICRRYLGGGGHRLVEGPEHAGGEPVPDRPALFALLVPYRHECGERPRLTITGTTTPGTGGADDAELEYPTQRFYRERYRFQLGQNEPPGKGKQARFDARQISGNRCYLATSLVYNAQTQLHDMARLGIGHWGQSIYDGVGRARRGLERRISPAKYAAVLGGASASGAISLAL